MPVMRPGEDRLPPGSVLLTASAPGDPGQVTETPMSLSPFSSWDQFERSQLKGAFITDNPFLLLLLFVWIMIHSNCLLLSLQENHLWHVGIT